jgi:transposase
MGETKPRPTRAGASGAAPERGRFSARRKRAIILRRFRGEPLETISREVGVTAATLSAWRE